MRDRILLSIFTLAFSTMSLFAQEGTVSFDHITIKKGLSDGRVDCILQDSYGFLWFGTQDGLNRYDGYNCTVFDHDVFDSTSISSNWIRCIYEDQDRRLWIGTEGGGLNLFDPKTEKFKRWMHEPGNPLSLNDNFVRTIVEDGDGSLWIGTRIGLLEFDRDHEIFLPFHFKPADSTSSLFNENVTELFEDSQEDLWIGTSENIYLYDKKQARLLNLTADLPADRVSAIFEDGYRHVWVGSRYNGLRRFDRNTNALTRFRQREDDPHSLISNEINAIFEDREENLWIGTMHGGLNLFDRRTEAFSHFMHDPRDPSSLSSNSVRSIYQDRSGILWIGMDGSGVDSYVRHKHKFQLYGSRMGDAVDFGNNTILSLFEDIEGVLWIGTEGSGLVQFSRKDDAYAVFRTDAENPYSISNDQVTCIFEDREGVLWVGTKEGLNKFHKQGGIFHRYYMRTTPITGNNFINVIHGDQSGNLLLGTNAGVNSFNKETGEFTPWNYSDNDLLNDETVVTLWVDESGSVWIGYLRSGLVRYDPRTGAYTHFRSDPEDPNSLSNNFVQFIYEDEARRVWIATRKGLNRYDPDRRGFERFTKANGLPSNVIVGILEDDAANLWLSTTNGLSKFDVEERTFTNYNVDDGLQGNQFWIRSCFKSQSGELFFGGNNGFNSFYPQVVEKLANLHIPQVVITNVSVLNRPLQRSVYAFSSGEDTVHFSSKENQVAFEFAALDFTRPEKNQFAYMLEGFENDWIYAGTRRQVSYMNLHPGHYTFRVRGSNVDGVWNEEGTSLSIFIPRPFWKTAWAYALYAVCALGLVYGINAYVLGLIRVKHDLKIERMEKEKVKEINQFKIQFFTDVAHEFKTPLTLIQAPLEDILASLKRGDPFDDAIRLMHRNVKYLLRLVQQLLCFRQAEQGWMGLEVSKGDLVQYTKEIFTMFVERARKHQIDYRFHSDSDLIAGWFDWEKLEEILVNLIDNAFKYTHDRGKITLTLTDAQPEDDGNPCVAVEVADTGAGIPPDQISHIFERFYQSREEHHWNKASSGLGLCLVKKLVELHHGNITVESREGQGSRFIVRLPLAKEQFDENEIITHISETSHYRSLMTLSQEDTVSSPEGASSDGEDRADRPLVLIVEDDAELCTYMRKALSRNFAVAVAKDGEEGIEKAKKMNPNIIISDVMMPRKDGFELCRELKNDITASHIPIVILTAKSEIECKIEGIETGADDYIEKPFHFRFLEARIRNLLNSRERLRERYRKEFIMEPKDVDVISTDEKFLKSIVAFIENRLDDPDLCVNDLTKEVGLSRSMLFRKLHELTDITPNELIKMIRFQKASQLLHKSDLTVGEIAYRVGFRYPKYFSTSFQQYYGMTPSQYRLQTSPAS